MNTQQQTTETVSEPEIRINDWAKTHNISATFKFVPFSQSRNAKEKNPSLNWRVTLYKSEIREITGFDQPECQDFALQGREIMTFDYMQGCGHAPSYKQNMNAYDTRKVAQECEQGRKVREIAGLFRPVGTIDKPTIADVLYSISSDADALNYSDFEDWASSFGYETDSRAAEQIYKTCIEYGLKLRAAVGDKGLSSLADACQDY